MGKFGIATTAPGNAVEMPLSVATPFYKHTFISSSYCVHFVGIVHCEDKINVSDCLSVAYNF